MEVKRKNYWIDFAFRGLIAPLIVGIVLLFVKTNRLGNEIQEQNVQINRIIESQIWKERFFRPIKEGTWNVVVKSLTDVKDREEAERITNELKKKYPNFHFRLVHTVARDGKSNPMYAIYFGNGLTKSEAQEAVRIAKRYIAADAYIVKQFWDSKEEYQ